MNRQIFSDIAKARSALLHSIPKLKFVVIGDVMLDRYLSGSCDRISPEAPVPVIRLNKRTTSLGGAANLAHNLANLGAQVQMIGMVGADDNGLDLIRSLGRVGIGSSKMLTSERTVTIVKTRVLAGDHQMLRFDEELNTPITDEDADRILAKLRSEIETEVDAVLLSDYAKGLCTPYLCQNVIRICQGANVSVYVDPKGSDCRKYSGATAVKPNRYEMSLLAQVEGWDPADLIGSAGNMRELLKLEFAALTLGPKGVALVEPDSVETFPTAANEVFDVSGAGDALLAGAVAGIHGGLSRRDAVNLGNLVAGQVTARVGCVPVERSELLMTVQKLSRSGAGAKIFTLDELLQLTEAWKSAGQLVGFTNGCFDILHAGHVRLLEAASASSDRLIVAINSDRSVAEIKGRGRPFIPLEQRLEVLAALECIDALVVFDGRSPIDLLTSLKPDLLAKGSNYRKDQIEGVDVVESYGGEVLLLPLYEGVEAAQFSPDAGP